MRLLRYDHNGTARLAVEDDGRAVDILAALEGDDALSADERSVCEDTVAFIASGAAGRELAERALERSRASGAEAPLLADLELCAPLRPEIILCSGENYHDHRAEKPQVEGKEPEFFIKVPHGVVGPGDDILLHPAVTKKLDYETELAVVIGREGRLIPAERALEHVYGYTIMNDVTARDRQVRMRPDGSCSYNLGPGKNFDTCAPMGPVLVTTDEIGDPQALGLRTLVNGEVRQNNSTASMIWSVAELVQFFSTYLTLRPGFVISTGTPGGTAWGTDEELGARKTTRDDVVPAPGYLAPGDEVRCEIEGIGSLRNRVRAA